MSDEKFWLIMAGIVITGFATIIISCNYLGTRDIETYVNAGYEQVILPGSSVLKWQKAD